MEKLIERIAKAPTSTKLAVVLVATALITVLNYFVTGIPSLGKSISDIENRITKINSEQRKLDADLMEKRSIANNLNQFRREKELLEQKLAEALAELPNEKRIDELLQLFQDRAQKAGLEISTIE